MYTVTDQAEHVVAQVVIRKGQTSITISGVEFGTYNVTEETSWSWRSTPQERIQQAVLDSEEGVTVTFAENTQARRTEWLSYEKSRVKVYTPGA